MFSFTYIKTIFLMRLTDFKVNYQKYENSKICFRVTPDDPARTTG
jgi:hypothetical protein